VRVKVCRKDEIPENGMRRFLVEGEPVLLARIDGDYFAISDTCSHAEARLSEGILTDHTVQCPNHGATFDVRTGEARSLPAIAPVERFDLVLEGDELYLELED
jgi:3-phenylpropionate/trans-cinnamate dioxygenase ferredoxin subunit